MRPGFWMVRCCQRCPEVAARIWLCNHEPAEPDNKVDQPYWQGQLGLDLVDPCEIWTMLEFCEAPLEEQRLMVAPPPSVRTPKGNRATALVTAPMAKWKQQRARRISATEFEAQVRWLAWAERNAPQKLELNYRRPVAPQTLEIPRFT